MPKVDYSQIKEMDFTPIPEGTYDAVFTGWELKDGTKGAYYNCEYTLDDTADQYKNRKVWSVLSLSVASLWRFKRDMICLGANATDMAPDSDVDTDEVIAGVVGASCRLKLKQESYEANDGETKVKNTIAEVLASYPM